MSAAPRSEIEDRTRLTTELSSFAEIAIEKMPSSRMIGHKGGARDVSISMMSNFAVCAIATTASRASGAG